MSMFDGRGGSCSPWAAIGLVVASMLPLGGCASARREGREPGLLEPGIERQIKQAEGGPDSGPTPAQEQAGAIDTQVDDLVSTALPKRSEHPAFGFDASVAVRNRYVASGFRVGDGPVSQSSFGVTLNEGPLPGARIFVWGDAQLTDENAAQRGGIDEVDLGLSVPLGGFQVGDGRVDFSADAQGWFLRGAPDVASFGASATYTNPSGQMLAVSGRHVFEHDSIPSGDFVSLQAGQSIGLDESGKTSLDFGVEYGRAFRFFGVDHQYVAPKLGLNLGLSEHSTLRLESGYQFGISGKTAPDQPIFGLSLNVKF
ncbi:MAG: hypothetical protein K1X79_03175 [Oligoflexia bacterium]|nr:hypothetical protein [Oligoflexia bacterium]